MTASRSRVDAGRKTTPALNVAQTLSAKRARKSRRFRNASAEVSHRVRILRVNRRRYRIEYGVTAQNDLDALPDKIRKQVL